MCLKYKKWIDSFKNIIWSKKYYQLASDWCPMPERSNEFVKRSDKIHKIKDDNIKPDKK